ncbi:MAG: DUF1700 domain-containing protein [Clostridia bacterium]|nr:DUF1700 domain-containing protein [Clostridia bacterium]
MTYKEWESRLVEELKGLPTAECLKITDYYKEMYGDRLDAGMNEEAILAEFGSPQSCAEKILAENAAENTDDKKNPPSAPNHAEGQAANNMRKIVVGVLFSLFAGIPLAAILVVAIASLGAVCISGGAGVIAGFVYIFVGAFSGAQGAGIAAHIGMGIGAMGVCGFLGLGGYFATKYSAIYSYKLMKTIYGGILK